MQRTHGTGTPSCDLALLNSRKEPQTFRNLSNEQKHVLFDRASSFAFLFEPQISTSNCLGSYNRQKDTGRARCRYRPNKKAKKKKKKRKGKENRRFLLSRHNSRRQEQTKLVPGSKKRIEKRLQSFFILSSNSRIKHLTTKRRVNMFNSKVSSKRRPLPPQKELELANIYLQQGHTASKEGKHEIALVLCEEAEASLSQMKKGGKSAMAVHDTADLHHGVGCAFLDLGKLLDELKEPKRAKESYKKSQEWGHSEVDKLSISTLPSTETAVSLTTQMPFETSVSMPLKTTNATQLPLKSTVSTATQASLVTAVSVASQPELGRSHTVVVDASVVGDFFVQDKNPPVIEYKLPEPDERLVSTHQLVYCLGLLRSPPLSDDPHQDSLRYWVKSTQNNEDELERLDTLTTNLVRAFIRDELKGPTTIAEVACIAPFLNMDDFRCLLGLFINNIENSTLLDVSSLEGLAKLVHGANEGYLEAADLVKILEVLNSRLQSTHQQTQGYIYQLMLAVTRVLDAMTDCKVEGLDRVTLHESLSGYINKLKGNPDPHMVYLAAYAFQALECVPDNESPWQATKRRTGNVIQGVFSLVKAVKGLDVNSFLEGLGRIENGLDGVAKGFQTLRDGYDNVTALVVSGQSLFEALKDSFSFDLKCSWYSALRGIDRVLQDGQLSKFRTLVLEAPCRRSLAFQWGVCQRLGDLAANPAWDAESREDALEFLAEIYQNDAVWGQHSHVKQKILDILLHLQQQSESVIQAFDKAIARKVLQRLKRNGDRAKQALCSDYLKQGRSPHPLKVSQPPFAALSLLDRVQNKPDVEEDLRKLKQQRLKERGDVVYIPPRAKTNLKASDDVLFDLTEQLEEFLASKVQKVMLLLGDSGSGKSTFNREIEHNLWLKYEKAKSRIPLYINLSAIERPEQDMIVKQLRKFELSDSQIRELKLQRKFVLICDGYDESQEKHNLYTTNRLNQTGEWQVQMVVSCRSEYIGLDYRDLFQPSNDITQFQEAVIAPFSRAQVDDYLVKYVITKAPLWNTKQYTEVLDQIPSLQDLVKNPFLLTLSLEVLPRLVDPGNNLTATRVTRVTLYDEFVVQWLEQGKKRLGNKDLNPQARADFDRLTDEGFTQNGISFLKDMASAIYKNQAGNPVVTYSRKRDQGKWKEAFFSRENESQLLLEASPLTRSGIQYRFIHKSLLEYFFARSIFEPQEGKEKAVQAAAPARRGSVSSNFSFDDELLVSEEEEEPATIQESVVDHPLSWRSFVAEPSILDFLSDRVQQEPLFKEQLLAMIEQSKVNKEARKAAANAITILIRAGVRFNGADLSGIQIPGADLSYGAFDSAELEGADLRMTNLRNTWLRQANLSKARMEGVQFGEWPLLQEDDVVLVFSYSPNGKTCAVGLDNGTVSLYDSLTWDKIYTLDGHTDSVFNVVYSPTGDEIVSGGWDSKVILWDEQTGQPRHVFKDHTGKVNSIAYAPTRKQIASGSDDNTVRLWNTQTGKLLYTLDDHRDKVIDVVYSPTGDEIVSGSWDGTVRLWDAQTGLLCHVFEGHIDKVKRVAYSPTGEQIASGSYDGTVRLWDTQTKQHRYTLEGHANVIQSVVFSPSGGQIASGGNDKTVRLWGAHNGLLLRTLRGHAQTVFSLAYSPTGEQIASGSSDRALRLWDTQTGQLHHTLDGHSDVVTHVAFSPTGEQIASGSMDKTVRLWDARPNQFRRATDGHKAAVYGVAYSPNGEQIASGSADKTVRLWDSHTGQLHHTLDGHEGWIYSVAYSTTGKQIASGSHDKTVRLWDVQTGQLCVTLKGHTEAVIIVAYSATGEQIASGSSDMTVRLWDTKTGQLCHTLNDHTGKVRSLDYSPTGEHIVSGSWDHTVRLWDARSGQLLHTLVGHTEKVFGVVFSPSGEHIASRSDDCTARLWDVRTGKLSHTLEGHTDKVESVAYSSSGEQIASGSDDKTVRLWDTRTGRLHRTWDGHTDKVESIAYSPNGEQIVSSSKDKTVRLWGTVSGTCLAVIYGFNGVVYSIALQISMEGYYLLTGCDDKSVRLWKVTEEANSCVVRLQWTSGITTLTTSDTIIQGMQGLSEVNRRLLQQRGSIGEPSSRLRDASRKASNVAYAISKFKMRRTRNLRDVTKAPLVADAEFSPSTSYIQPAYSKASTVTIP
ncbi:unnamed protein product [Mortierella alpina]